MVLGVINTGSSPKALWPGVHDWFGRSYNEYPEQWRDLVDVETSSMNYEEEVQITGFGYAPRKNEGTAVFYDSETQGFITRYVHVAYGLGFIVTEEEIEDNLYEKVANSRAKALAYSFRQTKEVVVAGLYNNAFSSSFTYGDGVSLLNTAHPNSNGGTWSNKLAVDADLSEASLEDLIIQIMGAQEDRALQIQVMPRCLVIPRQEWFNANRILKSIYQNDTANNAINVLKATNALPEGIKMNVYLTSPHAWFIRTNAQQGMRLFQRVPLKFTQDNDFDTDNAKHKGRERYSVGATDQRTLYGSNGP